MPDLVLVAECLLLGSVAGFLAGLLGVGGGMMMVPFITHMAAQRGVPTALGVKVAIATSLATILFTSVSSVRAHHARGAVRWDIVRSMSSGIVAGGLLAGAGLFALLKGTALGLLFALFVGFSATQMLLDRKPAASRELPGPGGRFGVGALIGLVSSMVGAGGAFISVPFMTWCNVPIRQAVGTSAAMGFPIALAGTLGYLWSGRAVTTPLPGAAGYLWLPALLLIASASVVLAPVGARVAHRIDVRQLKRAFAVLLYALAGYMAWRAWAG